MREGEKDTFKGQGPSVTSFFPFPEQGGQSHKINHRVVRSAAGIQFSFNDIIMLKTNISSAQLI